MEERRKESRIGVPKCSCSPLERVLLSVVDKVKWIRLGFIVAVSTWLQNPAAAAAAAAQEFNENGGYGNREFECHMSQTTHGH